MSQLALLALIWTFGALIVGWSVSNQRSRSVIQSRLANLAGEGDDGAKKKGLTLARFYEVFIAPSLTKLAPLATWATPTLDSLERQLADAGHPMNMSALELLGLKVFTTIIGLAFAGGLFMLLLNVGRPNLGLVLLTFPILGFLFPNFALRYLAGGRRREIRLTLPDMLDLLIINIEAGVGLDGAIYRAVERLKMPLTQELNRVLAEVQAGKPRIQSLREMAERLRIEELSLIIACIQQSEQLGTSIGLALRAQAQQMRKRRANELREIAAKLPTKLLIPIVFFIFPTLFLVLLGPGAIMMVRSGSF